MAPLLEAADLGPHVAGHAWLPEGHWMQVVAGTVVLADLQHDATVIRLDPQMPAAHLRRMVVASAMLT